MKTLVAKLRRSGIVECEEAADELERLALQLEALRRSEQALHSLTHAALISGYDCIHDAIAAAPLKSTGRGQW